MAIPDNSMGGIGGRQPPDVSSAEKVLLYIYAVRAMGNLTKAHSRPKDKNEVSMVDSLNLPGIPKKPGRRPTGKAKSNSQRMAEYRQRRNFVMRHRLENLLLDVWGMGFAGDEPRSGAALVAIFNEQLRDLKIFPPSVLAESAD